jgi:hypothetical protein
MDKVTQKETLKARTEAKDKRLHAAKSRVSFPSFLEK